MKQKIVITFCFNTEDSKATALRTVVKAAGVESAALQGQDHDKIEVIGEDIDTAKLVLALRKRVGYARIDSVTKMGDAKKEEKKLELIAPSTRLCEWCVYQNRCACHYQIHHSNESCSIM